MNTIGTIIFVVIVVLSFAQKIKEQAAEKRRQQGIAPPRPASAAQKEARTPPARELLQALLGVEIEEGEEEGEWIAADPTSRRELSRQTQAPPPLQRRAAVERQAPRRVRSDERVEHRRARAQHEQQQRNAQAQARNQEQQEQQEQQAQQKSREADASQRQQQQQRRRVPVTAQTPRRKRARLFGGRHEVRKAIVFAEILGPPKAFEDPQRTQSTHTGV